MDGFASGGKASIPSILVKAKAHQPCEHRQSASILPDRRTLFQIRSNLRLLQPARRHDQLHGAPPGTIEQRTLGSPRPAAHRPELRLSWDLVAAHDFTSFHPLSLFLFLFSTHFWTLFLGLSLPPRFSSTIFVNHRVLQLLQTPQLVRRRLQFSFPGRRHRDLPLTRPSANRRLVPPHHRGLTVLPRPRRLAASSRHHETPISAQGQEEPRR